MIHFERADTTVLVVVKHGIGTNQPTLVFEREMHEEVLAQAIVYLLQDRLDRLVVEAREQGYTAGFRDRGLAKSRRRGRAFTRLLGEGTGLL